MLTLSFGLGEYILVNAIIGLPTFKEWQLVLDVSSSQVYSKLMDTVFDLSFEHAAKGLPASVQFVKEDFVRPTRLNPLGQALVTQLQPTLPAPSMLLHDEEQLVIKLPPPPSDVIPCKPIAAVE